MVGAPWLAEVGGSAENLRWSVEEVGVGVGVVGDGVVERDRKLLKTSGSVGGSAGNYAGGEVVQGFAG